MWKRLLTGLSHRGMETAIGVGFCVLVFVALTCAVTGFFSPTAVAVLLLLLFPGALWLAPVRVKERLRFRVAVWALGLGSFLLTLPPGELIPGGWDPGVYLQTASQISRQGGLLFDHPDLIEVPADGREILFRDVHGIPEPFGGMRLFEGRVTPQFYHAYPSLLALVVGDGILRPALWVNPVLNAVGLMLMARLLLVWTGRWGWALAGGLLLLWCPSQIWQAKFSTAEPLTQVWILAGFLQLIRWGDDPDTGRRRAFWAGVCFGLAFLTRYDSIMLWMVLLPVLGFSAADIRYRAGVGWLLAGALPCGLLWIAHQRIAPFYQPLGPMVRPLFGFAAGLSMAAFLFARFVPWRTLWCRVRTGMLTAGTGIWLVWMGFAWLVRPSLSADSAICRALAEAGLGGVAESLTGPSRVAMLYLESLFTPFGLALILASAPLLWWRARTPGRMAWALSGAAVTLVLTWNPLNDLFMMWVTRRFIPLTLPWLISGLMVASALMARYRIPRLPPLVLRTLPVAACALILVLQAPGSWFQVRNREWPGALGWFASVAAVVPDGVPVYTDQPGFGSPLRFHWGKQAFELRRRKPELLERLLERIRESPPEAGAYLLTTSPLLAGQPDWVEVAALPMRSSMQIQPRTRLPDALRSRGGDFRLYRFRPEEEGAGTISTSTSSRSASRL